VVKEPLEPKPNKFNDALKVIDDVPDATKVPLKYAA
jgi:hypothetical protein